MKWRIKVVHVKTIEAMSHKEVAEEVEKFLNDNRIARNECTIQYSVTPFFNWILFIVRNLTVHYAMIIYEKEE